MTAAPVFEAAPRQETTGQVVNLRPENKLIFWTRWLLHIESERVAGLVLFVVVMALATAATIVYYNFA